VYVIYEEMCRRRVNEKEAYVKKVYTRHTHAEQTVTARERERECHSPNGVDDDVSVILSRHSHECRHIYKREACTKQ